MYDLINFNKIYSENRGSLLPIESYKDIPFTVKRIFILETNNMSSYRGNHAHKQLHEVLIPITGSFIIKLDDKYNNSCIVDMNKMTTGIILYPNIWRTLFSFSNNTKILSLCSHVHDENDYIKDWNKFINE